MTNDHNIRLLNNKIMQKVKTGFLQELQSDGSIANSSVRLFSCFFFVFLCIYTFASFHSYEDQFTIYVTLLREKCITEQSFNMLVNQMKKIDWDIFAILVFATVAPKVIQKFAETKIGVKDISESSTTTIKTDKTSTTP